LPTSFVFTKLTRRIAPLAVFAVAAPLKSGVISDIGAVSRAIQYATASPFNTSFPGILDHPLTAFDKASASLTALPGRSLGVDGSRVMTVGKQAQNSPVKAVIPRKNP